MTSYDELIGAMTNHPQDRHELAAAVAGRADMLVTENLKDFPPAAVAHLGVTVAGQDDFLSGLLELYPDACAGRAPPPASRYRREPRTVMALLNVSRHSGHLGSFPWHASSLCRGSFYRRESGRG